MKKIPIIIIMLITILAVSGCSRQEKEDSSASSSDVGQVTAATVDTLEIYLLHNTELMQSIQNLAGQYKMDVFFDVNTIVYSCKASDLCEKPEDEDIETYKLRLSAALEELSESFVTLTQDLTRDSGYEVNARVRVLDENGDVLAEKEY